MPRTRPPYPEQFRREAVELHTKSGRAVSEIAKDLGVTEHSLRTWVKQVDVDAGRAHGLSSEEKEELRRLLREVRVLREEREILKKVSLPPNAGHAGDRTAGRAARTEGMRLTDPTPARPSACGPLVALTGRRRSAT